jgi:hypothetical protein
VSLSLRPSSFQPVMLVVLALASLASEAPTSTSVVDTIAWDAIGTGAFSSTVTYPPDPPPSPPSPLPLAPPELSHCDDIHLDASSSVLGKPNDKGGKHRIYVKLWVRQWVPGGRVLLNWSPMLPYLHATQLVGARVVSRNELATDPSISRHVSATTTVLELNNFTHAPRCEWRLAELQGGSCVMVEGSMTSEVPPTVALRCIPETPTARDFLHDLETRMAFQGCPLDKDPLDGYSISPITSGEAAAQAAQGGVASAHQGLPSEHASEEQGVDVRLLLREWHPGTLVSMFWPGYAHAPQHALRACSPNPHLPA